MRTQRKTTIVASSVALLALAHFVGGCGSTFETNQQACERLFDYFRACVPDDGSVPPGVDVEELIGFVCAAVPEDGECNISVLTDCIIRNTTCDTIGIINPPECIGIVPECVVDAP